MKRIAKFQVNEQQKEKIEARKTNPLYNDLHQIAEDIHFFKTLATISIIIGVLALIYLLSTIQL